MPRYRIAFESDQTPPSGAGLVIEGVALSDQELRDLGEYFVTERPGTVGELSNPTVTEIAEMDVERAVSL